MPRSLLPIGTESQTRDSPVSTPPNANSGWALWLVLALVAVNVAVYAPVRNYGFIGFDDPEYVSQNSHVLRGLTWEGVRWAFSTGYFANWHPLTWLSHMLDVQVYGTYAGGHHITNVLLHITNTLLLFGLLHRMTGRLGRSAFVAGLFAVHPLHVESVAWVSERKDVLSTLFGMLTLWSYIGYVRRPRLGRYLVLLLFFAMGLMAKPMLVTLPFLLLLLDVWPLGRITLPADPSGSLRWQSLRDQRSAVVRLVWEKLPLIGLAVASSMVTFVVQQRGGTVGGFGAMPLDFRMANALVSYIAYIAKMLWPAHLSVLYPYPETLPGWWVFGSMFVLIGVSVAVVRAAQRRPYLAVGWLWYLGTLVPVIGLVQVGNQAMADRYTYVPLIGLFLMVAWGIPDLLAPWPYRRIVLPTAAGIVICACAVAARSQVRHWESDTSLWARTLEVTTGNYVAHNNLGTALAGQGKIGEAMAHYAEALRFKPDYADAHNNLGTALAGQGKVGEAMAHYAEALRLNPANANAHYNMGVALDQQGRIGEATAHYAEALRLKPDYADAHNNLAAVFQQQGRVAEAIVHYLEAVRLKPDYAEAHSNLGAALARQGRIGEAMTHFAEALRINPANERLRSALAELKSRANRVGQDPP